MEAALSKVNAEHALALHDVKNGVNSQIEKLTEAMALMVKATTDKENRTPNKRRRRIRRPVVKSSNEEESSEERETPPRIPK